MPPAEPVPAEQAKVNTLLLGGIVSMSPLAIDICLPAISAIADAMNREEGVAQYIISFYLVGFAVGHLVWGSVSDRFGRLFALRIGIAGFLVTSIVAAFTLSFEIMLGARLLQGVCGGVSPVVGRAIARDVAEGPHTARLMATLTSIVGFTPLLAPIIGGALLTVFPWQSVFVFMVAFALLCTVGAWFFLPETNRQMDATALNPARILSNLRRFFSLRQCRYGLALAAIPGAGFISVITGGGPILMEHFGLSALQFGWVFAFGAGSFVLGSLVTRRLVVHRSVGVMVRWGVTATVLAGALEVWCALQPQTPLWLFWFATSVFFFGYGFLMPNGTAIASEPIADMAGLGIALLGFIQMASAAVVSLLAATFYSGDHRSVAALLAIAGLATGLVWWRGK